MAHPDDAIDTVGRIVLHHRASGAGIELLHDASIDVELDPNDGGEVVWLMVDFGFDTMPAAHGWDMRDLLHNFALVRDADELRRLRRALLGAAHLLELRLRERGEPVD